MAFLSNLFSYHQIPDGVLGTKATIQRMAQLAKEASHDIKFVSWWRTQTSDLPSKDYKAEAQRIFDIVKKYVRYVRDPQGLEVLQAPSSVLWRDGSGDCFTKGTKVLCIDGQEKAIELLQPGDQIWGMDSWTTVKAVWDRGYRKTWKVVTGQGKEFRITPEHKLWLLDVDSEGRVNWQRGRLSNLAKAGGSYILPRGHGMVASEITGYSQNYVMGKEDGQEIHQKGGQEDVAEKDGKIIYCEPGQTIHVDNIVEIVQDNLVLDCFDIATEDHCVWLSEHDIVTSQCDEHATLIAAAALALGHNAAFRTICASPDRKEEFSHVYAMIGIEDITAPDGLNWLSADSTQRNSHLGWNPPAERVYCIKDWVIA